MCCALHFLTTKHYIILNKRKVRLREVKELHPHLTGSKWQGWDLDLILLILTTIPCWSSFSAHTWPWAFYCTFLPLFSSLFIILLSAKGSILSWIQTPLLSPHLGHIKWTEAQQFWASETNSLASESSARILAKSCRKLAKKENKDGEKKVLTTWYNQVRILLTWDWGWKEISKKISWLWLVG